MLRKSSRTETANGLTSLLEVMALFACLIHLATITDSCFAGKVFEGREKCAARENLVLCVSYYGTVPVKSVIPEEESPFFLDIFKIRLENRGPDEIILRPEDFYCITLSGRALIIDKSLYDRIVWPEKLTEYKLLPGQSVEKFLFFPSSRDYVRTIVHRVNPIIEVQLF